MNTYFRIKNDPDHLILRITGNKIDGDIIIDKDDYHRIKQHQWYIRDKAKENHHNYPAAKIGNKTIKLHRFILNITDPKIIVDHDDRNTLNCTKKNLIITDSRGNNLNTKLRCTNTSGRTGVKYSKGVGSRSDRWIGSYTDKNGKRLTKTFSIKKYGYNEAFRLAEKFREKGELELGIKTDKRSTTIES